MRKTISIVVSVFNEEKNIQTLYDRIHDVFSRLNRYDFELIFINDGSLDNTYGEICRLSQRDPRIKLIDLSRNFGNQIATSAGLQFSKGNAVITMDGDLQHPPELISELINKWEDGCEVVLGERTAHKDFGLLRKTATKYYFWFFKKISNIGLEADISDFRLLDRKVVDALNNFKERSRFLRGLVHWVGFKRAYVAYRVDERGHGDTKYSMRRLLSLGMHSITSFSLLPLRFAGYLGMLITSVSMILLLYMSYTVLFVNPDYFRPIAFFAVLNSLLSGLILIGLGFIAVYIGHTHNEVLRRPLYIVREKINFE